MKTPGLFLGAVLLFWGWQAQMLFIAVCFALVLESVRIRDFRFAFTASDFNKLVDVSTIFLAGAVVISLTIEPEKAIMILMRWMPVVFFPIICAQEISTSGRIDVKAFFLMGRKRPVSLMDSDGKKVDVSYIYAFFCILSAGSVNQDGPLFFIFTCLFFFWALWKVRSKRFSPVLWGITIFATILFGLAGLKTIHYTSDGIRHWMRGYYFRFYQTNPFKSFSAMGEIGKMKLSDRIVLRASPADYTRGKTYLLHNATYNKFIISNWFERSGFEMIDPLEDDTTWQINPLRKNSEKSGGENHGEKTLKQMTLYFRSVKKRAVLGLPPGVITISKMKVGICEKNQVQSIRVTRGSLLIKGVVSYTDRLSYDREPSEADLLVPVVEIPVISGIVKDMGLADLTEAAILKKVRAYFLAGYAYSLDLKGKGEYDTPLQNFLSHTKAGHCEFFATAAVLILRQAGIPARYATGFMAHEYSRMGNHLVVRERDAHAWAKAYVGGEWKNVDTTPPSFIAIDGRATQPSFLGNIFSFAGFKLLQVRYGTGEDLMERYGLWLILPLGLLLFFRLRRANRIKRAAPASRARDTGKKKTEQFAFSLVEKYLSANGYPKYPHETYGAWINRIDRYLAGEKITKQLLSLLQLHNRNRFSRSRLNENEKTGMDNRINQIVDKLLKSPGLSEKGIPSHLGHTGCKK